MAERLRGASIESVGSRRGYGPFEPERKAAAGGFLDDAAFDGGFVDVASRKDFGGHERVSFGRLR